MTVCRVTLERVEVTSWAFQAFLLGGVATRGAKAEARPVRAGAVFERLHWAAFCAEAAPFEPSNY